MVMGKRLRIYYMTQVETQPITFIMFVNYNNLMMESYKKYLYNRFREEYGFTGVPIVFRLKGKVRTKTDKKKDLDLNRPVHYKDRPEVEQVSDEEAEDEDVDYEFEE